MPLRLFRGEMTCRLAPTPQDARMSNRRQSVQRPKQQKATARTGITPARFAALRAHLGRTNRAPGAKADFAVRNQRQSARSPQVA